MAHEVVQPLLRVKFLSSHFSVNPGSALPIPGSAGGFWKGRKLREMKLLKLTQLGVGGGWHRDLNPDCVPSKPMCSLTLLAG